MSKLTAPFRAAFALLCAAVWSLRGYSPMAPPIAVKIRRGICNECPMQNDFGVCTVCNCEIEAKIVLAREQCPEKRWVRRPVYRKRRTNA